MTKGSITIVHTRANGTLLYGSTRGDGVDVVTRPYGFRFMPSPGCLGLPRSRDWAVQEYRINGAAEALRAAGWDVTVLVNRDGTHPFPAAEAERHDRAAEPAQEETVRSITPAGFSEAGNSPEAALRRIESLEAERRQVGRSLDRVTNKGSAYGVDLLHTAAALDDQIAYWRGVVKRAVDAGFKVWGPDDFTPGDFVQYRGCWFEVIRVNRKSLTLPHTVTGVDVVRRNPGGRTSNARYTDGIMGRRSAQEMASA